MGNRSVSLDVDASPRSVFALYVDPRRWSEWQPAAHNVTAPQGLGVVGARLTADYEGPFHVAAEVTAVEPGVRHQMRLSELLGLVTCTATTRFEPTASGTRLSAEYDYRVKGGPVGWLLDGFVGNMMVKESGRDFARLKEIAERESASPR